MARQPLSKTVGARVKALRTAAGLTQAHVAEASGLAVETISRIESGQNMSLEVAASVADAIGVPVTALFTDVEPPARTLTPAENRILALVRGMDEESQEAVYMALRHMVSVRNPVDPKRVAKRRGRG